MKRETSSQKGNRGLMLSGWEKPPCCSRWCDTHMLRPGSVCSHSATVKEYKTAVSQQNQNPRGTESESWSEDPWPIRVLSIIRNSKFSVFKPMSSWAGGLPWWLSGKEPACQCRRHRFSPWVGKIPWRRKWQPTSVFMPRESYGQRSLAGYSPWFRKSWT